MALYFIETRCFAMGDQSLFLGTLDQVRGLLDELSSEGWMVAAAYEVAGELAIRTSGARSAGAR